MKVSIFVGGRADLGPLAPVIDSLARRPGFDVTAVTALTFDAESLRGELNEHGVAACVHVSAVGPRLEGDLPQDLIACGARVSLGMSRALSENADVLVILGDRWELPWVVMPAVLLAIPVVHLHGGEVTEGAIDERVRHAVTKLADVHCVASQDAARRLRQLGEEPTSIHVTGAPGLDRFRSMDRASDDELAAILGRALSRPLALFTYHSVTTEPVQAVAANAAAALRAAAGVASQVLVTHPGPDSGRDAVLAAITEVAAQVDNVVVLPTLGSRYPSVLAAADIVVGNSSSGVIEAAAVGIPAVDIGRRQQGRLRGANVRHADDGFTPVAEAVRASLDPALACSWGDLVNPYGDGHAADSIAEVVASSGGAPRRKRFVDTDRPTDREYR